ncbi:extracellular matrix protein 2-like isoform X2 [Latimeria chalumnae]|uniref:extracellular matrix protein 2-like isoform X2 n=1 Tax=Latimeria chalumnae TaxID=7897 RepID=UPI0003C1AA73|nr:PREDICTED: extracellular matrix protein 2-like [Latimeria chalumnae]|eukprot:XP_006002571.1 PREDICTED: extracellular matrix protein 2-like [Latimeria chalumnae]
MRPLLFTALVLLSWGCAGAVKRLPSKPQKITSPGGGKNRGPGGMRPTRKNSEAQLPPLENPRPVVRTHSVPPVSSSRKWCMVNGLAMYDGAVWAPNACTICTCKGGNPNCEQTQCKVTTCAASHTPVGECCPVCLHPESPVSNTMKEMVKQEAKRGRISRAEKQKEEEGQRKGDIQRKQEVPKKEEVQKKEEVSRKPEVQKKGELQKKQEVQKKEKIQKKGKKSKDLREKEKKASSPHKQKQEVKVKKQEDSVPKAGAFEKKTERSTIPKERAGVFGKKEDGSKKTGKSGPTPEIGATKPTVGPRQEVSLHKQEVSSQKQKGVSREEGTKEVGKGIKEQRELPQVEQGMPVPHHTKQELGRRRMEGRKRLEHDGEDDDGFDALLEFDDDDSTERFDDLDSFFSLMLPRELLPPLDLGNSMPSLPVTCILSESAIACGNAKLTHVPALVDPGLKTLYLAENEIREIFSNAFSGLPNLEWLDLSKNKLDESGLAPDTLRNLTRLKRLILDGNQLTRIPLLPPSLEELKLNDNKLEGLDRSSFRGLHRLLTLELEGNGLHDGNVNPITFKPLRNLIYLRLDRNKLRAIPPGLPASLQELHLDSNLIEEVSEGILNKTLKLSVLVLSNNRLQETHLAPMAWINHPKMESMDLSHNHLVHVPSFLPRGLKQLSLHHNKIERIPGYVFAHLKPGLEFLQLSHNNLRDDGIHGISFLGLYKSLTELLLDNNQLRAIPRGLLNLKSLQVLRLNNNKIRYVPLDSICDTRVAEDSTLVSVHLENNLIDRREIPPIAFSCIKSYHSVILRPQQHED